MRDLPDRVNPGIRAAGDREGGGVAMALEDGREGLFENSLHGA